MEERRTRVPRDWLGHAIQTVLMLVAIGVPLLMWSNGINMSVATLNEKTARQEKDIIAQTAAQNLVINQLTELTRSMTRIETQLSDFREQKKR